MTCWLFGKRKNQKYILLMKKLLLSMCMALLMTVSASAGDVLFSTMTFPASDQTSVNAYNTSFTASWDGIGWTFDAFNNFNNEWNHIRCGSKNFASVAQFYTSSAISERITKIVVTFESVTANLVNSTYLEVASDTSFSDAKKVEVAISQGEVTYTVPAPTTNKYYRVSVDCKKSTGSNGFARISKVELYKYDVSMVSEPTFSPGEGNYYEAQEVTLSGADGDIYYSTDGTNYTKYTSPLTIGTTTTLYAYAQSGEQRSGVKSVIYNIAKSYASLDDLLKETPTASGWPVIVPITDEVITKFNGTSYRNGVYLSHDANGKDFELYCRDAPSTWNVGDKLSGTAKGIYQDYNGQWEISLVSWDGLSVTVDENLPQITPATGTYSDEQSVTITDPSGNNYTIYYTTDGTDPNESSSIYSSPFTVDETTTVKAVLVDDDDNMSSVATSVITITKSATYTTVAELIANTTATSSDSAPTVNFTFTDLLVTGVHGSNVFVSDATGTFLFYGSSSNLSKGDRISGSIKGKLYAYSNLPEITVSDQWANISIVSTGNTVSVTTVSAADITNADASKYVRIENLTYVSTAVVSKKNNITFTDGTTEVVVRDNFSILGDIDFTQDGVKFNMNLFVIPFRDTIQYYAVSVDDIQAAGSAQSEDVNGDGMVDTQDALQIYDYMRTSDGKVNEDNKSGDVNSDGQIDTQDVLGVYDYIKSN